MKLNYVSQMLLLSLLVLAPLAASDGPKVIQISAQRFAFSPNEITVKKGEPVTLVIQSNDVSHVIQDLGVRTEVKKGSSVKVKFTVENAGTFGGKCAHFCGEGHGSMTFTVHVTE